MKLLLTSSHLFLLVAASQTTDGEESSKSSLRESQNWTPRRFLNNLPSLPDVGECTTAIGSVLGRSRVPAIAQTVNALAAEPQNRGRNDGGSGRRSLWFLGEAFEWAQDLYGDMIIGADHPGDNTAIEQGVNDTTTTEATQIFTDVIIIGGGMAGLAAAAELASVDVDLDYLILESTDRTGGRVRAHTMGAVGREVVVEDGANWIIPFNENPLWDRAEKIGLAGMANDYTNWAVYDAAGLPVDPTLVQTELNRFLGAFRKAGDDAEEQWTRNHEDFNDQGVIKLLADNGWTVGDDALGNLDYIMQWLYIDFEYAQADTSARYFPYSADNPFLVTDQRGYAAVLDDFKNENVPAERILFNKRVTSINYGENICLEQCLGICLGTIYKARVITEDGTEYIARRVISTVSTGVLEKEYIDFTPSLKYSSANTNPYEMTQYIKIFYQFDTQFWGDTEFVEVALGPGDRGKCHHWQNMELAITGSTIIRCELMTEGFNELLDPTTQELSEATLLELLDPLRTVYGSATVGTPVDIYYPKINKDRDFGNGAYGNWKIGKTFTDFAKFFGGITDLTNYCDHNGCNSRGEWILQLSGSASCYDHSEFVHGAFFSGQRSARHVLNSMGYEGINTDNSGCDTYWNELTR